MEPDARLMSGLSSNSPFQPPKKEADEAPRRLLEAVNKTGSGEEIAVIIQRLSLAVNQMKKEERDEMLQRISEAKSLDDLINEFNRKDQMLAPQGQEQEQERVQQRPSSWDPQKRNWSYKSGQVKHYQQQQGKQYQQGFLISMFLLLPLASAKCSTCLGEGCYDTGQCILGCVPGYMNQYCDKACPSNCLNNVCLVNTTSATITCTDGCKAGYCGTKCTRPCPEGCVTCDRQCGSCNKTPCPERHYEEGCRSVCSQTYEKCDRETGQCIKCRRGYYGDNCDTKCPKCIPEGKNLVYKCFSGCKLCQDQDPCPEGLFGKKCELECSAKCGLSSETVGRPCNRATGECFVGCMPGYHGLTCNYTCSEHCLSGKCDRATGECSTGCMPGYHGLNCNYTCNEFCEGGFCNVHDGVCTHGCISGYTQKSGSCEKMKDTEDNTFLMVVILGVVIIFLVISGIICVLRSIRRNKKSSKIGNADKKERESLTGVINHSD